MVFGVLQSENGSISRMNCRLFFAESNVAQAMTLSFSFARNMCHCYSYALLYHMKSVSGVVDVRCPGGLILSPTWQ